MLINQKKSNRAVTSGPWRLLASFVQLGLIVSGFFCFVVIVLDVLLSGNFFFWLALTFTTLTIGLGLAMALLNFRYYQAAAIVTLAAVLSSFSLVVLGEGLANATLTILLADLLLTVLATLFVTYSQAALWGQTNLESSDLMIAIGRLENELEAVQATFDSLDEGLLLTDVQDRVVRLNRRMNSLLGLTTREEEFPLFHTINDWINRVRGVSSSPEEFKIMLLNAREQVRRGEMAEFIFGIEKPNPRYRAQTAEPLTPRPRLPAGPQPEYSNYGRNVPLLAVNVTQDESQSVFERDTRPLLYREMKLTVFPVLAVKGNMLGICYLVRDVTEEREVEQMKDNFISIVSHEVRTPMAVILGLTELLALPGVERAEQEEWLTAINQEAVRLRTVLEDMQSISRIKDGALELKMEMVELRELIDRIGKVALLQYRSEHKISIDSTIDSTNIYTDRGKVTQVLTNLMGNAIKYTPEGGEIKLQIGLRPQHPDQLYISVTDQGIGIPKTEQHKVFSRFFRSTNTRQKGIGGTGLGLAITQNLVKLMGGTVWFESEENQGSTFYFSLPLTSEDPTETLGNDFEQTYRPYRGEALG